MRRLDVRHDVERRVRKRQVFGIPLVEGSAVVAVNLLVELDGGGGHVEPGDG